MFESDPGQEGQIDVFRRAPTFDAATGQRKRPWIFRWTLSCSRHGYTPRLPGIGAFTPLPIQPRRPAENGKQERSGGYVKDGALKGRRFDSLDAQNAFLRHWNRTIARLRVHGTTRRVHGDYDGSTDAGSQRHALAPPIDSSDVISVGLPNPPGRKTRSLPTPIIVFSIRTRLPAMVIRCTG